MPLTLPAPSTRTAPEVRGRREEYLAFVAHDLRTPLNAISLSARVLEMILARERADTPQAALELMQNGKLLAKVPVELSPADGSGRIQELGRLPLGALAPGTYELRAVARQGSETVVRSTMIHLTD